MIDYTGQKFWYLTAYKRTDTKGPSRQWVWEWKCDCGNSRRAYPYAVKAGRVKSCGCKTYELQHGYRLLPKGEASFRRILDRYKRQAKTRNFEFSLSDLQVRELIIQPCYYCGEIPKQEYKTKTSSFIYNGIDRIDSTKGYIFGNVVPCCGMCNQMKTNTGIVEFLSRIKKIYDKHSSNISILMGEL